MVPGAEASIDQKYLSDQVFLTAENTARRSRNQIHDNLLLHMQQKVACRLAIRFMAGPGRRKKRAKMNDFDG